jgi:hypothetical protein
MPVLDRPSQQIFLESFLADEAHGFVTTCWLIIDLPQRQTFIRIEIVRDRALSVHFGILHVKSRGGIECARSSEPQRL